MNMIVVQILGKEYQFQVDSQSEDAQAIADYLKAKVEETQAGLKNMSEHKILMLAALNIASEFYQLKKEYDVYRSNMAQKSKRLMETIDLQVE